MVASTSTSITGPPSIKVEPPARRTVEKVLGKRKHRPAAPNPLSVKRKKPKPSSDARPVGTTREVLPLRKRAAAAPAKRLDTGSKSTVAAGAEDGHKRKKRNRGKKHGAEAGAATMTT